MRGISQWNYSPYTLLNAPEIERKCFINRIVPLPGGFEVSFTDTAAGPHTLCWRRREDPEDWKRLSLSGRSAVVTGLEDGADYAVKILRGSGEESRTRLVRPGGAVGAVVNYLHPDDETYAFSGRYLCSPSLLVLPSGRYLASMDLFAPRQAQNLTLIYESLDGGETWSYVTELYPCFWGKLFWHQGKVWMLGMSTEYGDVLLGCSEDEGHTWRPPVRLFPGSCAREAGPHKAPMPVIEEDGWLYTAVDYGSWTYGYHDSTLLSIRAEDDPLLPENWHMTPPLAFRSTWPGLPEGNLRGCLEGNAVAAPDGGILNILRLQQNAAQPSCGNAVILRMTGADDPLVFERVISFPLGANSKFVILRDCGWYIAVGNESHNPATPAARNVLSVAISRDLCEWQVVERVVDRRDADPAFVAFQYPDACMDGDDLLILSRTAMNGANSFHNGNLITFHRVADFRRRLTK